MKIYFIRYTDADGVGLQWASEYFSSKATAERRKRELEKLRTADLTPPEKIEILYMRPTKKEIIFQLNALGNPW